MIGLESIRIITDGKDGINSFVVKNLDKSLQFFQNCYRIFLTRGMLGTFIFCEHEETKEYLESLHDKDT